MPTSLAPLLALCLASGAQPRPCTQEEAKAAGEGTYLAGRFCKAILLALDRGEAEATLDKHAPDVVWRRVLELDVDGDKRVDFVLLGKTPSEAVVGVVFGGPRRSPVVFRFRRDGSQGGICGDPGDAEISVEDVSGPDDPDDDSPAEARAPAGSLRKDFRLDSGDCDAFHFFFDGKRVTWWRR